MNPALALLQRMKAAKMHDVSGVLAKPGAAIAPDGRTVLELARTPEKNRPQSDAERIDALPAWDPDTFTVDLTEEFATPSGTMQLNTIQSLALYWFRQMKGLLGPIAVGKGKGLLTLLAPVAVQAQRPAVFIPPNMQIPLRREIDKFSPHWKLPLDRLHIIPYSVLSQAKSTDLLDRIRPDVMVFDEAHCLRHPESARTKRVIRYARQYPETKFMFLSGTLTSRSLKDYVHLAELALRHASPLPLSEDFLIAWANCIDAQADGSPKDWDLFAQWRDVRYIEDTVERRKEARHLFRRRLITTPGVVATSEGSVECSLTFTNRNIGSAPDVVQDALYDLRETWTRPDGEELVTPLDVWRVAMQLSQGFYYRWVWPENIVDREWMGARSLWHKAVRDFLKRNIVGLDSPFLVTRAVLDGRLTEPLMVYGWERWDAVRHRPKPPVETVWLDAFIVQDAIDWRKEHPRGLIWYDDKAIEAALRLVGEKVYGAGEVPPEDGSAGGLALSISAHGKGLNMQPHNENLVLSWQSGAVMEQLIGRTHRQGQKHDEVTVDYYSHTAEASEALNKSIEDAKYQEQTTGSPQKLIYGSWT